MMVIFLKVKVKFIALKVFEPFCIRHFKEVLVRTGSKVKDKAYLMQDNKIKINSFKIMKIYA